MKNIKNISSDLPDNNDLVSQIFDNALESILIIENNFILYCNNSCKELFNSEVKDIRNKLFSDIFLPEEKDLIDVYFKNINNDNEFNELLRFRKKNNGIVYCETKIKSLDNKFIVFIKDVTSTIKSEKINTVLYSIAKAVNITDSIDQLYNEIHLSISNMIDVTNFFIAIYNEENDTIEFPLFLDEKDKQFKIINVSDKRSLTAKVIRDNKPIFLNEKEIRHFFKDDKIPWGTLSKVWIAVPLRIENKVIGAIGAQSYSNPNLYTVDDISLFVTIAEQIAISIAWKFTEEKLILSEDKFKKAFKTNPDAININRLKDGLYIDVNKGFTEITGYSEEETIGKTSLEIDIWVDPKDREKLVKELQTKGICPNLEAKFKFKNGTIHTGLMSAAILTLNGEPHILSISRDIQEIIDAREEISNLNLELEQKVVERTVQLSDALDEVRNEVEKRKSIQIDLEKYQEELAQALKSEKKLNELKSRFISVVSHEYRTPLTIIYTSAELLDKFYKENNYKNHKKHSDRILSTVDDMIKLIDDVLDVSKGDARALDLNFKKINIVENIYYTFDKLKNIDKNKHQLDLEFTNDEIYMETDASLLEHIISNLLTNAIKYTPEGKHIDISVEDRNSYVSIEITDEGIGIPENEQSYVFNHFYRAENVGTIDGTGLGLSIVKRNIETLNGIIVLSSVVNEGTTFNIKLPKIKSLI